MATEQRMVRLMIGELQGSCEIDLRGDKENCKAVIRNIKDLAEREQRKLTTEEMWSVKLMDRYLKTLNVLLRYNEECQ